MCKSDFPRVLAIRASTIGSCYGTVPYASIHVQNVCHSLSIPFSLSPFFTNLTMTLTGGEDATMCDECNKQACRACFVGQTVDEEDICNSCGFQCTSCHQTIRRSIQEQRRQPFSCEGRSAIKNSTPCPFGKGQGLICWECEDNGAGGRRCSTWQCRRMACNQCNVVRSCNGCDEAFCVFCGVIKMCANCNHSLCSHCNDLDGDDLFFDDGLGMVVAQAHEQHPNRLSTCDKVCCTVCRMYPSLSLDNLIVFALSISSPIFPISARQCKIMFCTHCKEVWCCVYCQSSTCIDCSPKMRCATCERAFCANCKIVDRCGLCNTMHCEDCITMAFCNLCEKLICFSCGNVTMCSLCDKSLCNVCSSPAQHQHDCSHCLMSYCGACRTVRKCSSCSNMTCTDCDMICEECKKVGMLFP